MRSTSRLYRVLRDHSGLDRETLDALQNELANPEDGRALGELVVRRGLLTFYDVMNLAYTHDLLPKTEAVLRRLAEARQRRQVIKPQQHTTRYQLADDERMNETIELDDGRLRLTIPRPNLGRYSAVSTDEKQVVEMAVELVNVRQLHEAEMFLIDARDEFPNSVRVSLVLVWLYFLCGHYKLARDTCLTAHKDSPGDINLLEYLGLIDQCLGKHLSAVNQFQRLTLLPEVKPIWYLLLAYSLEHSRLRMDAVINYRIFLTINRQEDLTAYATRRLDELAPQ